MAHALTSAQFCRVSLCPLPDGLLDAARMPLSQDLVQGVTELPAD